MNDTTDIRRAVRDLFQFHLGSFAWLPVMLALVTVSTLVVLLSPIPFNPRGPRRLKAIGAPLGAPDLAPASTRIKPYKHRRTPSTTSPLRPPTRRGGKCAERWPVT